MAEQNNYPRISEKNWWIMREKFKASLPAVVSTNYVKTLLTLNDDNSANSNVLSPMKRLGLLNDENKPTPLANDWRLDDKYQEACRTILSSVYPQELLDLFPDKDFDRNAAKNWFMGNGVGSNTAGQMVALYALLVSGEIKSKQDVKATTSKKAPPANKTNKKKEEESVPVVESSAGKTEIPPSFVNNGTTNRPNLHIDLQIHISPDSTPEQIETIFASMAKYLYGADNA